MDDPTTTSATTPPPVGASRKKIAERPEGLLPKIARVTATMLIVAAVLAFGAYQRVQGQLGEHLLGAGAEMMMLADATRQDTPRQLMVNGQRIFFSSGMAPMPPREVLARFEQRCEQVDAHLMAQFSEVVAEHPDAPEARRLETFRPLLREERDGVGFVACLDLGHERADVDVFVQRFRRFRQTRDLHDLGDLRYVYVEPASNDRTHFVAIWSEGSLRFDQLMPETGDAPGVDPTDIPRPPGARRVVSAREEGIDEVATIYQGSELEEGQLESFYRRELPAYGWRVLDPGDDPRIRPSHDVRPALVAQRGDQMVWFALSTDAQGRGTAAVVTSGEADGG
ncbi:hypothetical protein [Sandaracinus amylolyticus]|uniref:hypothetical protein n=1 Tax=Sandaracinus amylolyticus TaxID=927083 RepID=UPI001F223045|nr:hypothetical protein [Sandaracinus amylolyticus]UJR87101.1 Hypothetical protein I5071_92020 [Sandaracinus amylolyticus]